MADRLQKVLANAGYASRREIEKWIEAGRVTVNGKRAKLGMQVQGDDRVFVDGKPARLSVLSDQQIKALIYNKPEGEICSRNDPKGRKTIFENLPSLNGGRWIAVGRLDLNTSGLIIFTNNGELANRLMHPSTGLQREYLVRVRGFVSPETIDVLTKQGVMIDDKLAKFESVLGFEQEQQGSNAWYRVVIKEGRYREVRRMWDAVGHTVSRLKRIRYGSVKLGRDIRLGQHQKMAPMQLEKLIKQAGLQEQFVVRKHQGEYAERQASKAKFKAKSKFSASKSKSTSKPTMVKTMVKKKTVKKKTSFKKRSSKKN